MNVEDLMKRAHIAEPCSVDWDDMSGDDKVRFCGQCKLNVMNAAALTDTDVLKLLQKAQTGERVCMQIYRRHDGTFLTENCPVGLRRLRERVRKAAAWFAGALSMLISTAVSAAPAAKPDAQREGKPTWHATVKSDCSNVKSPSISDMAGAPASPINHYPMKGKIAVTPSDEQVQMQKLVVAGLEKNKPNSLQLADAMVTLASLQSRSRDYRAATKLQLEALRIYESKKSNQSSLNCCRSLMYLYENQGDQKNSKLYSAKASEYEASIAHP